MISEIKNIALAAGEIALGFKLKGAKNWQKGDGSIVTEADIAVDKFLKDQLLSVFNAGWLSEETADNPDRLQREWLWVVDPIDGTRAYSLGDDDWAISIALLHHNKPVLAVLYRPDLDYLYEAEKGKGTYLNGVRLQANTQNGFKIAGPQPFVKSYFAKGYVIQKPIKSLALRIVGVVDGTLDLAIASSNAHDWDIAAADLIVSEAGAVLHYEDGEVICYNKPSPKHRPMIAGAQELIKGLKNA